MNEQELEEQGQEAQGIDRENQLLQEFSILQQDYKLLLASHTTLVKALVMMKQALAEATEVGK